MKQTSEFSPGHWALTADKKVIEFVVSILTFLNPWPEPTISCLMLKINFFRSFRPKLRCLHTYIWMISQVFPTQVENARLAFFSCSFILLIIRHWISLNLDSSNLLLKNWSRSMLKVSLAKCAQNWHNICFQAVKTNVVMFTMFIRFGTQILSLPAHVRLALKSSV